MKFRPTFLYGTAWKEDRTEGLVTEALKAGFRAIDTANQRKHYFEEGVGRALKAAWAGGSLKRGDLFLQSKFTYEGGQDHRLPYDPKAPVAEQVRQSFASSLEHLGTDYLDSYLIHGPESGDGLTEGDWEAWRAMEELHDQGKARALGISNVNAEQVVALVEGARVKPTYVQNRCYPGIGWDPEVREVCRDLEIVYQGFSLVRPQWLGFAPLVETANRVKHTPAQVLYAFARQLGMLPMTGTSNQAHMAQALESLKLTVEQGDLEALGA
ncbi:MAG TPA: aldo/keto reductase [Bdellovibrionota bacterium]|jgi:diketogulonate reductase-like aldo/keto reductase|nr:aldo/keto reductase [Bdellovibrionota bacterium]